MIACATPPATAGEELTGWLLTDAEIKALVPFINEEIILGGFYTPGAGVVDSLRAATITRTCSSPGRPGSVRV